MDIKAIEAMLEQGQESAMLRYTLGSLFLKKDNAAAALAQFEKALELEPEHSASWKLYGKALAAEGREAEAIEAYEKGIEVAERRGDIQAAKEMKIFLKRLRAD